MKRILTVILTLSIIWAFSIMFVSCAEKQKESTTTVITLTNEPEEDVIEIIDGYIWVNGVNTGIKAEQCDHCWQTVTTAPTCTAGGYDTVTCKICEKSYTTNETPQLNHTFDTTYSFDGDYHWLECEKCGKVINKDLHCENEDGICTVCEIPVSATPGVIYDVSADGTYAEVVGYEGVSTKVRIAEEYKGLPVKNICPKAFYGINSITMVIIPDSVISIGESAFYSCYWLTSVTIGNSVTNIEKSAFMWCSNLTNIIIPDSVTNIGNSAFRNCEKLGVAVIGTGVTNIGWGAFSGCSDLQYIAISNSVTHIGDQAFWGCNSLLYTEYEYGIYVGSGDNPYAILIQITNKNMSSYSIHKDTQIIAYGVFKGCDRLTSIVIPNSVEIIDCDAFAECSNLKSIVIGKSVTNIGIYAFGSCSTLVSINYDGTMEEWKVIIKDSIWNDNSGEFTVYCTDGSLGKNES